MATTSTSDAVIDAALAALNADLPAGVNAFEAWPGPDGGPEMVCLGEVDWIEYEVASIKAGRQRRNEEYTIGWEVYVFGAAGTSPANPKPARERASVIAAEVVDIFADNPKLGVGNGGWAGTEFVQKGPRVFEKGWAYRYAGTIHVNARLT